MYSAYVLVGFDRFLLSFPDFNEIINKLDTFACNHHDDCAVIAVTVTGTIERAGHSLKAGEKTGSILGSSTALLLMSHAVMLW